MEIIVGLSDGKPLIRKIRGIKKFQHNGETFCVHRPYECYTAHPFIVSHISSGLQVPNSGGWTVKEAIEKSKSSIATLSEEEFKNVVEKGKAFFKKAKATTN